MFNRQPKNITNHYHNVFRPTTEIDYEKLAKAMVKAQQEADKQKEIEIKEAKIKQQEEIIAKRKEILKEKDFSDIKCKFCRVIRTFFNTLRVYKNIMFLSKENIKYFSAVDSLINSVNALLFRIFRMALYLVSLLAIILIFFKMNMIVCIVVAFVSFTIAQLIRIAENEVENMTEREYAMAIFSGLISVMSLIVSVVSIITT